MLYVLKDLFQFFLFFVAPCYIMHLLITQFYINENPAQYSKETNFFPRYLTAAKINTRLQFLNWRSQKWRGFCESNR